MIEFKGYIDGAAKKRWFRINRVMGVKLFLVPTLLIVPGFILHGINSQNWLMVGLCVGALCIIPLAPLVPQGKKATQAMLPKRIVVDDGFITCTTESSGETRRISNVKKVYDHGEFYELVFPFGKISTNFICQKSLLARGSLADFEKLFKSKLTKLQ